MNSNNFVMMGVSNKKNRVTLLNKLFSFPMDFLNQRTGGVYVTQVFFLRLSFNLRRDAVSGKKRNRAVWNVVQGIDKHSSLLLKIVYNPLVVNDFMIDVYRRSVFVQRSVQSACRPIDARAKSAGKKQFDKHYIGGYKLKEASCYNISQLAAFSYLMLLDANCCLIGECPTV